MNPNESRGNGDSVPDFQMEVFPHDEPPLVEPAEPPVVTPVPPEQYGFGAAVAFLWCLLFLLVAQIIPGAVGIFLAILFSPEVLHQLQGAVEIPANALQIVMGCTHVAGLLFSLAVLRWHAGKDWARKIALRAPDPRHLVLVLIGMPGLLVLSHALEPVVVRNIPSLSKLFEGMPNIETTIESSKTWPWWLSVLLFAVGPAVNEELWCRGFLGRGLVARYGYVGGVLVTSFFFGLIHVEPPQAVLAALLGSVIHAAYVLTRSLPVAMLMHFLNNGLAILAISETGNVPFLRTLEIAFDHAPARFTLAAGLLVAAVGYALYESRARLVAAEPGRPAWEPPCPSVALPPAGSGTVVVHDGPSPGAVALVLVATAAFGAAWFLP